LLDRAGFHHLDEVKPTLLPFALATVLSTAANASPTEVVFGPFRGQPGQNLRLVSHSESKDGSLKVTRDGVTQTGSIQFVRERDLTWTFRAPEEDGTSRGMVTVAMMNTAQLGFERGSAQEDFFPARLAWMLWTNT